MAQLRRWRDRLALSVGLVTVLALGMAGVGLQAMWQAQDRAALSIAALDRSSQRLKEGAGPAQAALALLQRKSGSLALALAHLAQALPQDSYLTTLSATGAEIDLSGQTLTPEGIIPALSADPVFATVNFAGPAAHDPASGSYSFAIHATLGALP
ncbi:MAG: PilN domain-containing protein [Pseudomonadota bacterium]